MFMICKENVWQGRTNNGIIFATCHTTNVRRKQYTGTFYQRNTSTKVTGLRKALNISPQYNDVSRQRAAVNTARFADLIRFFVLFFL